MQPGQVTAAGAPDRLPGEDVFLASIAGYVDTLGFVALFGLFTAHVTGNFILIGSAWGRARAADQMARVSGVHRRDRGRPPARPPDARARSWRAGRFAVRVAGDPARRLHVRGDRGVADRQRRRARDDRLRAARRGGDGVQNAHGRLTARSVVANTVMTGNVTQAVIDAFDWLVPIAAPAERDAAARGCSARRRRWPASRSARAPARRRTCMPRSGRSRCRSRRWASHVSIRTLGRAARLALNTARVPPRATFKENPMISLNLRHVLRMTTASTAMLAALLAAARRMPTKRI